jgi:hypothetical protein
MEEEESNWSLKAGFADGSHATSSALTPEGSADWKSTTHSRNLFNMMPSFTAIGWQAS